MKPFRSIAVALVLSVAVAGCGASREEAKAHIDKTLTVLNGLTDTLATVKDAASAKAALPKIEETTAKLKELKATDPKVAKSILDELKKEYDPKFTESGKKIGMEILRVSGVPGGKEAGDAATKALDSLK